MNPRFGKYYSQAWPHSADMGVGLEFIGFPTDVKAFIDLFQEESCNPVATRRILEDLRQYGSRKTTVMSHLPFEYIGNELHKLGVTMKVIPPIEPHFSIMVDGAAFSLVKGEEVSLESFPEEERQEVLKRASQASQSFVTLPHDFGPYAPGYDFSAMRAKKERKLRNR